MRNYTQIADGTTFSTPTRVDIQIQSATDAHLVFTEVDRLVLPSGKVFDTPSGAIELDCNVAGTIVQVDIATGQPTGQTYPDALLFSLVYSKYYAAAVAQDARIAAEAAAEVARRAGENAQ